jgi:hypothetical protein
MKGRGGMRGRGGGEREAGGKAEWGESFKEGERQQQQPISGNACSRSSIASFTSSFGGAL